MTGARARVLDAVERLAPRYRGLLQQLVRVPSPVGDEGPAQEIVARHMREIGLDVRTFDVDPVALGGLPGFNRTPRNYAGRPCVAGRAAGHGGGRSLLLNAHIDTVPVESPETWTHPPFAGVIEDGRLHGRGACDDKAGVVECLLVAHALKDAAVTLAGDVTVAIVVEDESSGNGTLASVEQGYTADGVIIVDGTWPERFIVSHMGQTSFRIRLPGAAGHATSPGANPLRAIGPVLRELDRLVARRNAECAQPWGGKEHPVFVNVGVVRGGVWPGSIPGECILEGQYGFVPPVTCDTARADIAEALAAAATQADWPLPAPATVEFAGLETPPHLGDPNSALARLLIETVRTRQQVVLVESVIAGHCDLRHYTGARSGATTAACLYGPGGGRNVHGADEYFELAHLPLVAGNLACVALDWCGVSHDR